MSIPLSDVLFFGGGQCLQRFGTLSWRTSIEQDRGSVEQYTRAGTVPAIGRDGAVRYVGANVTPIEWVDSDSDGDRDLATLLFQRALWPLGWALFGLSGEYAIGVRKGQAPSVEMPADWDANEFAAVGIVVPAWVHTDGEDHVIAEWYLTVNDRIQLYKAADNSLKAYIVAGGVAATATLSKSLTAGVPFFVGLRAYSGTLYLYADTDADADLDAASVAVGTFGSGTWTLYPGASQAGADHLEGFVNLLITNNGGSAAPITDRFNAGAGMALAGDDGWMARHGKNLVLHVGGNAAGTAVQAETYSGATDMLAGTATGRADLSTGNFLTTADPGAGADGLTEASWGIAWDSDEVALSPALFSRWDTADNQFLISRIAATSIRAYIADAGNDAANYGTFAVAQAAGTRYKGVVTYNAGTLALHYATYDPVTGRYGAVTTVAPAVTGTIPVALRDSALGYSFAYQGGDDYDGKLDDVRVWNGKALTAAEAGADLINAPSPLGLSYWWSFDGDGVEAIAGLTAAWTGAPAYVDDGRHGLGSMERWTKAGAYAFPVATNKIVTNDPGAGADGLAAATWELYWTATATATGRLLCRADGAANQFSIVETATGLRAYIADAGNDAANYVDFPVTGYAAGKTYKADVVYDGGEAAADRVAAYVKALAPESGRYGAQETPTPAVTGAIAATLQDSALGYTFGPDSASGGPGAGSVGLVLDEVRIWYGVALTSGEADAEDVCGPPVKAGCSHWWDFVGDAVDSIAALDGTPTGAIQWYDGRIPEGLTLSDVERIGRGRYLARKTISRASVGRYYDGVDYLTRTAPAGHLRDAHYWTANDGVTYRTTLLGRAYTNLVSSDDIAAWTQGGTAPVTSGISDPVGGTGAYRINHTTASSSRYRTVPFTGDGVKAVVFVFRESSDNTVLRVRDLTASADRFFASVSYTNGEPTGFASLTGTVLDRRYVGNGYWAVFVQTTSVMAANNNIVAFYGAAGGSVDAYRVNAFNDAVPPQDILDASGVRAADSFVDAYTALPQAATHLMEGVVADLANQGTARTFWNLGNGAGATAAIRLYYEAAAARLVIAYHNGVSEVTGYWTVALALSDRYSVRFHQAASGAIDAVGLTINGGGEDTTLDGAFGGTLALPVAWASAQIVYAGTNATANSAHTKCVSSSGAEKSLATMQALLETDASCLYLYVPGQYTDRGTYSMWMQNTGTTATAQPASAATTTGLWSLFRSRVRELIDAITVNTDVAGIASTPAIAASRSLAIVARGVRETAGGARNMKAEAQTTGFGYFDDMTWYQLPVVTMGAGGDVGNATCYFPWPYGTGVGAFTLLVDMDELGALLGAGGVLHIGAADATTGARVTLESTGAFYRLTHSNGSASAVATLAAAPSYGNRNRLRCVINPNGSVILGQTIGTAAETTATDVTAVPFASAWAAQRLYVGCAGTTKAGDLRLRAVRAARGVQTLTDMEGIFA